MCQNIISVLAYLTPLLGLLLAAENLQHGMAWHGQEEEIANKIGSQNLCLCHEADFDPYRLPLLV